MQDLCGEKRTFVDAVWVCTLPKGHLGEHRDGLGGTFVRRAPRFTRKICWTTEYERALAGGRAIPVDFIEWSGMAFVVEVHIETASKSLDRLVTFEPTGAPFDAVIYSGHVPDSHNMEDPYTLVHNPDEFLPIEFDYHKETGVKTKLRRFYVAHPKIQDDHNTWAKSTLQEAVDHATELVEKTGQTQYVVKIIKVVSRARPPIKVEDVR